MGGKRGMRGMGGRRGMRGMCQMHGVRGMRGMHGMHGMRGGWRRDGVGCRRKTRRVFKSHFSFLSLSTERGPVRSPQAAGGMPGGSGTKQGTARLCTAAADHGKAPPGPGSDRAATILLARIKC